jgi:putative transposase
LAARAQALGRKAISQLDTLVSPDTLLRWHRQLIAQKWNYGHRHGVGRPRTKDEISTLVLRMVTENASWGYTRLQGALMNVGYKVGRGTIPNILWANGIDPTPLRGRRTTRETFLKAQWKILVASDFFTVEVWRLRGLTTYYVLFFIELTTRVVTITGVTTNPNTAWMMQMGRNVLDCEAGMMQAGRKLIVDRDTKYSTEFRRLITDAGCEVIRLPPRAPNLNAYAERFMSSIKSECLNRLIFFGEASLRHVICNYATHYHRERNHQGLDNQLIAANDSCISRIKVVGRRARLGGLLSFYCREAA